MVKISKYVWSPPSRPCNFSLCLEAQGGSVAFADFDIDPNGSVFLVRISFDGYGCCQTGTNITRMPLNESGILVEAVNADDVDRKDIRDILSWYFQQNDNVIWRDALEEFELVKV
jgi:hypothetical protein